jgi:hypothetical protein
VVIWDDSLRPIVEVASPAIHMQSAGCAEAPRALAAKRQGGCLSPGVRWCHLHLEVHVYLAIMVHNLATDRACVGHTSASHAEQTALASLARTLDRVISVRMEVDYLARLAVCGFRQNGLTCQIHRLTYPLRPYGALAPK